jgi:iduronate 2-sulfatase
MKPTLLVFLLALSCAGVVDSTNPSERAAEKKLNVLFIAIDDLRPELGCYGASHVVSPNIDKLAATGVMFERAYCQSAVCNPSRASLMTGQYPETLGVLDLWTDLRKVQPDVVTLPQYLGQKGYFTASVGKIYHNNFPDEPSWDERHYVAGFPFDPDAVYIGKEGLALQAQKVEKWKQRGQTAQRIDRFGHYYVKAQATEAPDVPDSAYYDGAQTDWAVDKLTQLSHADEPFFLAVGYYRPHLPFNAPSQYWDLYDRAKLPLAEGDAAIAVRSAPSMAINNMRELRGYTDFSSLVHPYESTLTEAEQRRLKHGYLASVSYIDAQVGRLLEQLEELGLAENTIVVLWGDHGWKLGEHRSWGKMTNYEIDTRVPLLVRAPGAQQAGRRVTAPVELVDVFPTLCELTGTQVPNYLEGSSLAPLLEKDVPWTDAAFSIYLREGIWVGPDGGEHLGRAIRTATHRFVEWRERASQEVSGIELYDHQMDPSESNNVADDPKNANLVKELAARLQSKQ